MHTHRVERLTYVRSTYVWCRASGIIHLPQTKHERRRMKKLEFFLHMNPPKSTYQEKGINWKAKTQYSKPNASDARAKLRAHLVSHIPDEPFTGPIRLTIIWGFLAKGNHEFNTWYTDKPDLDNAQKAIQDVMTELGFWKDDSQVVSLQTSKIWTWHPGISIWIEQLSENIKDCYE